MIHILNNLPMEYKSKVESLEIDLHNEDCPLTLDQMTDELNLKDENICKKNEYDPESGNKKRKVKIIQMTRLQQCKISKVFEEGVISLEMLNISKVNVHLRVQMKTRNPTTKTEIKIIKKKPHQTLQITTQMTTYLPEDIYPMPRQELAFNNSRFGLLLWEGCFCF